MAGAPSLPHRRRVLVSSAAVVLLGVGLVAGALLIPLLPAEPLDVNIRWAAGLDDRQKAVAARELGLVLLETRNDGAWLTRTTKTSTDAVRRLVQDPRVADTHNVVRRA